jgi:hypothetical protein
MLATRSRQLDAAPSAHRADLDAALRNATGYGVDASEGALATVTGIPLAGRPLRPLVLVVRSGDTMSFVARRCVAAVDPQTRRVLLHSRPDAQAGA